MPNSVPPSSLFKIDSNFFIDLNSIVTVVQLPFEDCVDVVLKAPDSLGKLSHRLFHHRLVANSPQCAALMAKLDQITAQPTAE